MWNNRSCSVFIGEKSNRMVNIYVEDLNDKKFFMLIGIYGFVNAEEKEYFWEKFNDLNKYVK